VEALIWKVEFDSAALKQLRKIDRTWQRRIIAYLEEVAALPDPHVRGKPLRSNLSGLWRYRVGDYRLICQLQDDRPPRRAGRSTDRRERHRHRPGLRSPGASWASTNDFRSQRNTGRPGSPCPGDSRHASVSVTNE